MQITDCIAPQAYGLPILLGQLTNEELAEHHMDKEGELKTKETHAKWFLRSEKQPPVKLQREIAAIKGEIELINSFKAEQRARRLRVESKPS